MLLFDFFKTPTPIIRRPTPELLHILIFIKKMKTQIKHEINKSRGSQKVNFPTMKKVFGKTLKLDS